MKPGAFDAQTAREIVGDDESRVIEANARNDAEAGMYSPPIGSGETYWGQVQAQMRAIVYGDQYRRRMARLERVK